jgi:NAD(P)-dependent dehydrogenase (short-subunit alcohol dehydrogenase family)
MRVLALRGAHVIAAARTLEKAEIACSKVAGRTTAVACELSDLSSVTACAERVQALAPTLDILMCNAGIMAPADLKQINGIEQQFQTNHLAHFVLVNRLLDNVIAANQGRIIILSSGGHTHTVRGGIDFHNLSGDMGYQAWKFYGQSKLANILMSNELARRLQGTRATCNAVHPGVIRTQLARNTHGVFARLVSIFATPFERSVEQGAATQCYVATSTNLSSTSGKYFADCKPSSPSRNAKRADLATRLWQISQQLSAEHL